MLFSYNFGDKKTDETAQILNRVYEKILVIKFHSTEKSSFCYFHTLTFAL